MTAGGGESPQTPQNDGGWPGPAWEPPPAYAGPTPDYPEYPDYAAYPGPPDPAAGWRYPPPETGYPPGYWPGYPPGGYGSPAGYPLAAPPGNNPLAVFSLVVSVIGLVPLCGFISSLTGILLGAVALTQIKRTGQAGYGLAVAGIVIGVATLVVNLVLITFAMNTAT
jgi:hypothetical protein